MVRFGIENLFDEAPPLLERNSAPPPFLLAGGTYGGTDASIPRSMTSLVAASTLERR